MACGCAVVASNLPAVRDVVRNRENGLLVAQNSAPALAAALRELSENDALRKQLAATGLASAARFDWSAVSENYTRIIAGLLQADCEPALPTA
jgi:glycosyltransferase involved in cell wall biosynthesis